MRRLKFTPVLQPRASIEDIARTAMKASDRLSIVETSRTITMRFRKQRKK